MHLEPCDSRIKKNVPRNKEWIEIEVGAGGEGAGGLRQYHQICRCHMQFFLTPLTRMSTTIFTAWLFWSIKLTSSSSPNSLYAPLSYFHSDSIISAITSSHFYPPKRIWIISSYRILCLIRFEKFKNFMHFYLFRDLFMALLSLLDFS